MEYSESMRVRGQTMANALRFLAADMIECAQSGHPGAPLGMADMAQVLWCHHLRYDPAHPTWFNRDRFVLSNGHASALLYALLYLTGYNLSEQDLRQFRQLHSKTPGHPEFGLTPGVDTTTGPLGQGLANAVGMALAEKRLSAEFNKDDMAIVDHFTYVVVGDGCLMEGISHEVCSLAARLELSKLIVLYDDNGISIDGPVSGWFSDDTPARFKAYGWHVISAVDGHDLQAINIAITEAKNLSAQAHAKPVLICCKTVIGKGAPTKAGTEHVHGAPLGSEELRIMRRAYHWPEVPLTVPNEVLTFWREQKPIGALLYDEWQAQFARYAAKYPELSSEFMRRMLGELPSDKGLFFGRGYQLFADKKEPEATRKSSQNVLNEWVPALPDLFGGSADLTGSNLTRARTMSTLTESARGDYLSYGVREFGMAAMMNGIALHGGMIPYGGTFLVFSDYSKNAIRMAALMRIRVIHVLTHDSIGLGEDGPTHQAVEHLCALRSIPNLAVWRPADALESAVAWACSLERAHGPSAIVLSRQNLPQLVASHKITSPVSELVEQIRCGGYVLIESQKPALQIILIATGSELSIAVQAQSILNAKGIGVRVVSMPSTTLFDQQVSEYQRHILPLGVPKIAIEAAHTDFWYKYVGLDGGIVGLQTFGESAPASELYDYFKINASRVVNQALELIK